MRALGEPPMRVLLPPAWITPVTVTWIRSFRRSPPAAGDGPHPQEIDQPVPPHRVTAPARRTRGGDTVRSSTVEGSPPEVGPPSSTRSICAICSPNAPRAARAVAGGGSPERLALG